MSSAVQFSLRALGLSWFLLICLAPAGLSAPITWREPLNVTTVDQIDTLGELVEARNATGDQASPVVSVGTEAIPFAAFQFGGPVTLTAKFFSDFGGDTGSVALNTVFDSFAFRSATVPWSFELAELEVGNDYQIQIFAGGDRRDPQARRHQIAGDGEPEENLSGEFSRGGVGSVIGRFTASTSTQTIRLHPGETNGLDPAISGYILRKIPPQTPPLDIALSHDETVPYTPAGTLLGFLSAADINDEDSHAFELVEGADFPGNALFSIVGGNQLRSDAELGEAGEIYEIRIRVADSSSLEFEKTLVFRVTELEPIGSVDVTQAGIRLEMPGRAGRQLGVEYSSDLQSGGWAELGNAFDAGGGLDAFIDPDESRAAAPRGFYRVFVRPLILQ